MHKLSFSRIRREHEAQDFSQFTRQSGDGRNNNVSRLRVRRDNTSSECSRDGKTGTGINTCSGTRDNSDTCDNSVTSSCSTTVSCSGTGINTSSGTRDNSSTCYGSRNEAYFHRRNIIRLSRRMV